MGCFNKFTGNATAANSSITFNINSITNWTIASNQGWLTVSKTGGSNNDIIILTASANLATEARTAIITVIATGDITQTIYVKQFGIIPVSEKWNQFLTGNYNDISVVNDSVIWLSYSNTGENKISYTLNGGITWITKESTIKAFRIIGWRLLCKRNNRIYCMWFRRRAWRL
ncbi:MAG: hypothetical protein IPF54_16015 [Draconibacterium sp.]|nr:hypothetical protein [Draconibacterium sp.]